MAIEAKAIQELPEGFKLTELGPLPEQWEVVRVSERCDKPQYGYTATASAEAVGPKFLRITDIQDDGVDWATVPFCECPQSAVTKYGLRSGDILIARIGATTGKSYLAKEFPTPAVFASYLIRVRTRSTVDPEYLYYFCNSQVYWAQVEANKGGKLKKGISGTVLASLALPLPSLPEQRAIARVLSTIQQAIEATERVIAAAGQVKSSLMRHLFTYGLAPIADAERVALKETEIGPVPGHWEVSSLRQIVEKTMQIDPRKDAASPFKYVDVSAVSSQSLRIQAFRQYQGKDAASRARKLVRTNDIIFATVRPYLKRVAMVPPDLDGQICSTAFCVIRCKPQVADPQFVFQTVTSDGFVRRASEHQRGSSYPAVTDKDVLSQLIPLPPLPEQREIGRVLSSVDRKMEAEQKHKATLRELFRTMLHLLMTGQVRVKDWDAPEAEEVD